jgi:hypothetical protein
MERAAMSSGVARAKNGSTMTVQQTLKKREIKKHLKAEYQAL